MPFGLQLDVDAETEASLTRLAKRLEAIGDLETVHGIGDCHHLSLGVWQDLPVRRFIADAERFANSMGVMALQIESVGMFPGEQNVLFLAPVVSEELLALHQRCHAALAAYDATLWEHYRLSRWVPHVTLAMNVHPAVLPQVMSIVTEGWTPRIVQLPAVRIIGFRPVVTEFHRRLE